MDQRNALSKRAASKLDVESQWFAVFDIIFPGSTRPSSPYNSPVSSVSETTYIKLRELLESDGAVEAMYMNILGSLNQDLSLEKKHELREAVRRGVQGLVEVHKRAIFESGVITNSPDDDEKSSTSTRSVSAEVDPDPSGLSQPLDDVFSNTSTELPSVNLCSGSWAVYPDEDVGHVDPSADLQLPQKREAVNFSTSADHTLSVPDYDIFWAMQQGLAFHPAISGSDVESSVSHRNTQVKATVPQYPGRSG